MMARRLDVDKLGALAGTICAVHCVLTGLAVGVLSVVGLGFLASPLAEVVFFGSALLIGGFAIRHGIRRHHHWAPATLFLAGMLTILAGHFFFHGAGEHLMSALGGAGLVGFHFLNHRMAHKCGCRCRD